jgi:hypothetical protein
VPRASRTPDATATAKADPDGMTKKTCNGNCKSRSLRDDNKKHATATAKADPYGMTTKKHATAPTLWVSRDFAF